MKRTHRLYIAYGSNMCEVQMMLRCPNSIVLGKGVLKDFELNFCGNLNGGNFATVVKKSGAETPVILWMTTADDELRLDRYEGYPSFYRKEIIPMSQIELEGCSTDFNEAYIYIMNSDRLGTPSVYYYAGILNAYNKFGIDTAPLEKAYARAEK